MWDRKTGLLFLKQKKLEHGNADAKNLKIALKGNVEENAPNKRITSKGKTKTLWTKKFY